VFNRWEQKKTAQKLTQCLNNSHSATNPVSRCMSNITTTALLHRDYAWLGFMVTSSLRVVAMYS